MKDNFESVEGKNIDIVQSYVNSYLSRCNYEQYGLILGFIQNVGELYNIEPHSIDRAKEAHTVYLNNTKSKNKSGLSTSELEQIAHSIYMFEYISQFLDDLENFHKLFSKKGVETDYPQLLAAFESEINKRLAKNEDVIIEIAYDKISSRSDLNFTAKNVVIDFYQEVSDLDQFDEDSQLNLVSRLLAKFHFDYDKAQLSKLVSEIREDRELQEFEKRIFENMTHLGDFQDLDGHDFEQYLSKLFEALGYKVMQTPPTRDQGADLILMKDNQKTVVQAKKHNAAIGNKAIQEIAAAKNHYKANKALVVTSSFFSQSAIKLSLSNQVELWDGAKLREVINSVERGK